MDERELLTNVYTRTASRVPLIADQVAPPPGVRAFGAEQMLRGDWLAARVEDMARQWWGSDDPRVNATLWWYSASSTLVGIPVATALVTGIAAHPRLEGATGFLRADGYLGGIRAAATIEVSGTRGGLDVLAAELRNALGPVVDVLADVSGVRRRVLWAITTDSAANRSLDAGSGAGDAARGSAFAHELVDAMRRGGTPMPVPRFVDVTSGGGSTRVSDPVVAVPAGVRRFTERCSCCLIYETGADKCVSCPRRSPEDRVRGLVRLV